MMKLAVIAWTVANLTTAPFLYWGTVGARQFSPAQAQWARVVENVTHLAELVR